MATSQYSYKALEGSAKAQLAKRLLSDTKFYSGYSRWDNSKNAYETWEEAVQRVMNMHRQYYADKIASQPLLGYLIDKAEQMYAKKRVLGAQRALQFGGEQLLKHQARLYNCSSTYIDRPAAFNEAMYLLLCGCGVGFSVQNRHISKLPYIRAINNEDIKRFVVPDTIEGWADAFAVLLSAYFEEDAVYPEYAGKQVHFDFSQIRPRGAPISGGFKAPGPDGLKMALQKCEALLNRELENAEGSIPMRSIVAYDFIMHMSDAVLSGGVRRSATICLFDKDDEDMLNAKTGNWFVDNPQRGRSNNSVVLLRDSLSREEWAHIMKRVREFGEPGFVFVEDLDFAFNPCVEIGMYPQTEAGVSGFQFCNLTEINGGECTSREEFLDACVAAAILGTLQAGYTNFKYVSAATREITEREALIGVSITGWMDNPDILFNEKNMIEGATLVKSINRQVAELIGIRPAARTTCAKPSGNASVLLGTKSGIHGGHAPLFFRHVQMLEDDSIAQRIMKINPKMVERSVWSPNGKDVVVAFPFVSNKKSIYRKDLMGVKQLDYVKKAQQYWVEHGTNEELCRHPKLRHNISNTISVDNWDEIEDYLFENKAWFAGVSLLPSSGDKIYPQAPFTEVLDAEEILEQYGEASMFASGLIVDGMHAFNGNLWEACRVALNYQPGIANNDPMPNDVLQRDWIRRFYAFAYNFFDDDITKSTHCLKDCYNLHKWVSIMRSLQDIDFVSAMDEEVLVDADSMGAQACAGGVCEVQF